MDQKWKNFLLWSYLALLSFSIVTAGICLAAQCLAIYRSGDHPFTPEVVAIAFSQIALPIYFCIVMIVLGFFLKPLLPCPKRRAEKNYDLILSRLEATVDLNACPKELEKAVIRLLGRRSTVQILGWILLAAGSIVFLIYGADPAHYHQTEINGSMVNAMAWLIPCMAVPFAYGIFAAYYRKQSIRKEIELLKTAPAEAKCPPEPATAKTDISRYFRCGILAAALVLIIGGYFLGGAVDVLTKAVNICTECIGLG